MAEEDHKLEKDQGKAKEAKRKRKRERRQSDYLYAISNARWQRLGSLANWITYRVRIEGKEEIVPVRRGASRIQLANLVSNVRRAVRKEKEIQKKQGRTKGKRR